MSDFFNVSSAVDPVGGPPEESMLPRVNTDEDRAKLKPGEMYFGADEKKRQVPYQVTHDADYDVVPEGAHYVDPEGNVRAKPKYEGIGFTAQTLYDMSVTDEEKRKSLDLVYPGKVKQDKEGYYVEDEKKLRRPGRGLEKVTGFAASAAAPTFGAALGATTGSVLGSAVPGPGTFLGGAAGAGTGAAAGEAFNEAIMTLAGVYSRTPEEQLHNVGASVAGVVAGEGLGAVAGAIGPEIKQLVGNVKNASGAAIGKFLGADPTKTKLATEIAGTTGERYGGWNPLTRNLEKPQTEVPPSAWAMEAPHIHNITEVFEPALHTQEPLLQSAGMRYQGDASKILESVGTQVTGLLAEPTAAVSSKEVGESLLKRAQATTQAADAKLDAQFAARRQAAQSNIPQQADSWNTVLSQSLKESQSAANKLLQDTFKSIDKYTKTAMRVAEADGNSGDLWRKVGAAFEATKMAGQRRFEKYYNQIDEMAGHVTVPVEHLAETAGQFLAELPADFENQHPRIVRQLRDLVGVQDADGNWIKEPVTPTWVQARNLRTQLRQDINWTSLPSDVENGTYKFFNNRLDEILHLKDAPENLQTAAHMLDITDLAYREFIRPLKDQRIQAVMNGLRSDLPADPQKLFNTIFPEGRAELMREVQEMVGPNLAAAVKAADLQAMLTSARSTVPGQVDANIFAREVMKRHRHDMLEAIHGKTVSNALLKQVESIEMLEGRLDIPVVPGDTMTTVIAKARAAQEALKLAAAQDPMKLLSAEMRKIGIEQKLEQRVQARTINKDPLGFLYKPTTGAVQAADRILEHEDLMFATEARFGRNSSEFKMLQQVWLERLLTGTMQPGKRLASLSPEAQQLMAPGATLNQLQTLARNMDFLLDTRAASKGTAQGMAAMSKVEHPITQVPVVKGVVSKIPGANPAARWALGNFYAMVRKIITSPSTLRWITKGLDGTSEQRDIVKRFVQRGMNRGGALGAAGGELIEQSQ